MIIKMGWLAVLFLSAVSVMAEENITSSFLRETQKYSSHKDGLTLAWWIPVEFWKSFMAQEYPRMTEARINEHTKFLDPYLIFLVADAKLDEFGDVHPSSEAFIRANMKLKDSQNNIYLPLNENDIDADTKYFLQIYKRTEYRQTARPFRYRGGLAYNISFILFPSQAKDGQLIADTKKHGSVSVIIEDRQIQWNLPLLTTRLPVQPESIPEAVPSNIERVRQKRLKELHDNERAIKQKNSLVSSIIGKEVQPGIDTSAVPVARKKRFAELQGWQRAREAQNRVAKQVWENPIPTDFSEISTWDNPTMRHVLVESGLMPPSGNGIWDRLRRLKYRMEHGDSKENMKNTASAGKASGAISANRPDIDRWAIPAWREYQYDTFFTRRDEIPDLKK